VRQTEKLLVACCCHIHIPELIGSLCEINKLQADLGIKLWRISDGMFNCLVVRSSWSAAIAC